MPRKMHGLFLLFLQPNVVNGWYFVFRRDCQPIQFLIEELDEALNIQRLFDSAHNFNQAHSFA